MVGALLNRANLEAEAILQSASGDDRDVKKLLERADKGFGRTLQEFAKGRWGRAAALAVEAYDDVQRARARAGLQPGDMQTQASNGALNQRRLDPGGRGSAAVAAPAAAGPSRHPCHLPAGMEVDPAHLPPGCALGANGSASPLYCSLPSPG